MSNAVSPPSAQLDARGLFCPEPVMLLHNAVRDLPAGECLEVLATDPSTQRDIPRFCSFLGHQLLEQQEVAGEFRYLIRKGAAA
ncbi:sulfurtransferase TusA [Halopseudomonas xiamenensis]|uniref:sulfurtransferase TusA n=1 Tax=Halopseudomonas xiamenensis TaxID=157792 RepID=UPI0016232511|nr:sulfurtransferase TusA [Halopseudomonas xiamenensis]